jgi:putative SOS response-associated peptidase YedK
MCGRYSSDLRWDDVAKLYDLSKQGPLPPWNFQPNYNVCPTDNVPVVIPNFDQRQLVVMRWGLIPSWWGKPLKEAKLATFNARAESVHEKPFFREAFKRTRCLIPASGYYEWHTTPEGKQPYYFTRRDGQIMTFAGLYDTWHDKAADKNIQSCAMVITEPNKLVAEVHDRMPVILEREQFDTWMRTGDVREAAALLKPAGEDVLQKRPVSKRINSSRTPGDDPSLIDEVDAAIEVGKSDVTPLPKTVRQGSLF